MSPVCPKVIYDAQCPICLRLAQFAERKTGDDLEFVPWQKFREDDEAKQLFGAACQAEDPEALLVVAEGVAYKGQEAWSWLLKHHPYLKPLDWLAVKLNISKTTAQALEASGHGLRRMCVWCRPW